jgi:uncharacterized protein
LPIFGKKKVLRLNIANLSAGHYEEAWQTKAADLDLQDRTEFQTAIDLQLHIEKASDEIIVTIDWQTVITLFCDRCAEPLQTSLSDTLAIVFTLNPQERGEEDEDVLLISESTREVDLADHLRQSVILALPVKQLCSEECKGLCSHCGANLNTETCNCPPEPIDPRWEKLEQLLNRKN